MYDSYDNDYMWGVNNDLDFTDSYYGVADQFKVLDSDHYSPQERADFQYEGGRDDYNTNR